jgi:micrococcal nuclease
MGTRITNLPVTKVVDGDTVKVMLGGVEESLRLACVDTEESLPGSDKPVTEAGKAASAMAKDFFAEAGGGFATVDLEFDTDDPVDVGQARHRDNFGRLLCYLHKGDENYNLKLVREGWSPYFVKYGRSRQYHEAMTRAEADAQAANRVVWDPATNGGGPSRDYPSLLAWWAARDALVEEYRRHGVAAGVLSVRLDYERLAAAARERQAVAVLCDLQEGVQKWTGGGALIYAGSVHHKFNLWIPDADAEEAVTILRLIEKRYAGQGRGYVYVSGTAELYRTTPQIVLTARGQLADFPPA